MILLLLNSLYLFWLRRPFLKKHQILNWEPALVIEGSNSSLEDKLIRNISNELSNFKIPKKIYYIKNFYRNNYGKIDRSKIYNQILKNAG